MRIQAGEKKGSYLRVAKSGIRPTRSIVRSAIFNIISEKIKDARVIDIFAGTGALGIEALSRGAQYCVFIERSPKILIKNISELGLKERTMVIKMDFRPALKRLYNQKFDIIFIDPPYKGDYSDKALKLINFYNLLNEDGIIVIEHSRFNPCPIPEQYIVFKEKKYGDTIVSFLKIKRSENEKSGICRNI